HCQLDDAERQRCPRGIGFGPALEEVPGLRHLEEGAGDKENGEQAGKHPAGDDLPLGNGVLRHCYFTGNSKFFFTWLLDEYVTDEGGLQAMFWVLERLIRASCSASARPAHGLRPRGVNPRVAPAASPNRHSMAVRMSSASR